MTEGLHSMKLPQSWDTGCDQSGVLAVPFLSCLVAPGLLRRCCVMIVSLLHLRRVSLAGE